MSAPTVVSTGITIICPDEAPRFIKTQTPIHILCLTPACSPTSQHFHLPPCYRTHQLTTQYISQHSEPHHDEYLISRIQNIATLRGPLEWDPATSLG